jgi:hypothetical protein
LPLPLLLAATLPLPLLLAAVALPLPLPLLLLLLLLGVLYSKSFELSAPLCSDSFADPPATRSTWVGCSAVAKAWLCVMATTAPVKFLRAPAQAPVTIRHVQ